MLTKEIVKDRLNTDLVMKSKTISHIILEGTDGVGKTTMLVNLLKHYNYRYIVYDRGEISNFFYAEKYHRQFVSLQRNLPFLHVLLTCNKDELKRRILSRQKDYGKNNLEMIEELNKIDDQDDFIRIANQMKNDFHIIIVDISGLNEEESTRLVARKIDDYIEKLPTDEKETEWNQSYRKACEKLHIDFKVRNNQPYMDGKMVMSESTWQNGAYETFSNKDMPDNLIFSLTYDCKPMFLRENKTIDFAYVINSKINRRPEIIDYYFEILNNNKTCLVSQKVFDAFDKDERMVSMPRVFGDEFIQEISKARATVYCGRDLEYLKLQTCRLYEGILAYQIVFVDQESDRDCEILDQIYGNGDLDLVELLYVTPETIIEKYEYIMSHEDIYNRILDIQMKYYDSIRFALLDGGVYVK